MNGSAPEIRSAMFVGSAYLQVLFYDKTYDETGFEIEIQKVNPKGKSNEPWTHIFTAGPGDGISLKDSWGNWMTWGGARIYISTMPYTLKQKAYYMVRIRAIKDIEGVPTEYSEWDNGAKVPIQYLG